MTNAPLSETTVVETITIESGDGSSLTLKRYADNSVLLCQGGDLVFLDAPAIARVKELLP